MLHVYPSPPFNYAHIEPSDVADLDPPCQKVRALTAGAVRWLTVGGQEIEETYALGDTLPALVRRIFATGTTAAVAGSW